MVIFQSNVKYFTLLSFYGHLQIFKKTDLGFFFHIDNAKMYQWLKYISALDWIGKAVSSHSLLEWIREIFFLEIVKIYFFFTYFLPVCENMCVEWTLLFTARNLFLSHFSHLECSRCIQNQNFNNTLNYFF